MISLHPSITEASNHTQRGVTCGHGRTRHLHSYRATTRPAKHLPEFYKEKGKMSLLQLIVAQKASNPFRPSIEGLSAQWRSNNFATFPKASEGKRMLPDVIGRPLHSERRFGGLDSSSSPDTIGNTFRSAVVEHSTGWRRSNLRETDAKPRFTRQLAPYRKPRVISAIYHWRRQATLLDAMRRQPAHCPLATSDLMPPHRSMGLSFHSDLSLIMLGGSLQRSIWRNPITQALTRKDSLPPTNRLFSGNGDWHVP
ncbi:hypothetical protein EDC04DRAFT_2614568 [Pisolithus marmoratus]|nr:hypothetical protein EDC04DRAFT_2614568 [Pisolithus marmoratus]